MSPPTTERKDKLWAKWFMKFARQEIASKWKPTPSKTWTVAFYMVVAVLFVGMGAFFLEQTLNVVELKERYDDKGEFSEMSRDQRFERLQSINSDGEAARRDVTPLTFTLEVTRHMKAPIYVFYELSSFFQNHKRYVRSLSSQQLGGDSVGDPNICDPKRRLESPPEGHELEGSGLIVPCGLIASSMFNDTYNVEDGDGRDVPINKEGIAWEWDRKYLYGDVDPQNFNPEGNREGGTVTGPLNQDEAFMVWMRVSAAPSARKLYGRIEEDLPKGTKLTFTAENRYNTYKFGGKKYIVLSTSNWTGGRNIFIGVLYIVVGGISAVAAVSFFLVDSYIKRPPGDLKYLSWVKKDA